MNPQIILVTPRLRIQELREEINQIQIKINDMVETGMFYSAKKEIDKCIDITYQIHNLNKSISNINVLKEIYVNNINKNTTIAISYLGARMFYSAQTHIDICIDLDNELQTLYDFEE